MKRVLVYGMTDNPGGIESYLLSIIDKAKEKEVQLDFVTDFDEIAYRDILKKKNAKIFYIPAKGKKLWRHLAIFYHILKDHPEYESVYFNILDAGAAITMIVPHLLKRKVIVHSHNGDTDKKKLHLMCRPLLNILTDEYVTCSGVAAEFMFGNKVAHNKEILMVPNAIDVKKYDYDEVIRENYREKMGIQDKFVVCHVGRITKQKNPFRLVDIFLEVCKKNRKAVLLYIGSGDLDEEVRAYVKGKKLENKVLFLGRRNDVAELMQASDVFLLPSLYEGLPIVAIEAQASGLPTILSSNITREVNVTGTAKFVDLENSDDVWAECILETEHRNRQSCRLKIEEAGYGQRGNCNRINTLINMMR